MSEQPREPKGSSTGGQFASMGGSSIARAFESAPEDKAGGARWVKDHQSLYDDNPEFRAAADAITLFTQGEYKQLYHATVRVSKGEWQGTRDTLGDIIHIVDSNQQMAGSPIGEYTTYFKGQSLKHDPSANRAGWQDGAKALNRALDAAPKIEQPLHRGLQGRHSFNAFKELKEGDTFDVAGATSFTLDKNIADKFSSGRGPGQYKSMGDPRTIITVRNARGLKVAALSPYKQKEVIVKGKFKVKRNSERLSEDRLAELREIELELIE